MMSRREWIAALASTAAAQELTLESILSRVSEEAEAFRRVAPSLFAEETLEQRARLAPRRFRPRIGAAVREPPAPRYRQRRVISEYGFGSFRESPGVMHEFRKVVSVDGKRVSDAGKARLSLSLGVSSADDNLRKRLLLDFEKAGLTGTVTDFGQLILLFSRRRLTDYEFTLGRRDMLNGVPAVVVAYLQRAGTQSLTIFEGRQAVRQQLRGELWVRQADGVPLKVTLTAARFEAKTEVRDEASTEYAMSAHGALAPVAVIHRQYAGKDLNVENVFRYAEFRRFAAESEIRFTPEEEPRK